MRGGRSRTQHPVKEGTGLVNGNGFTKCLLVGGNIVKWENGTALTTTVQKLWSNNPVLGLYPKRRTKIPVHQMSSGGKPRANQEENEANVIPTTQDGCMKDMRAELGKQVQWRKSDTGHRLVREGGIRSYLIIAKWCERKVHQESQINCNKNSKERTAHIGHMLYAQPSRIQTHALVSPHKTCWEWFLNTVAPK